jgi:hypothetical protein
MKSIDEWGLSSFIRANNSRGSLSGMRDHYKKRYRRRSGNVFLLKYK